MERSTLESDEFRVVTHRDDHGGQLMAIHDKGNGQSMVSFSSPLLLAELTEAESVAVVDEFARTVGVLFAEMLARLAAMRGGQ